MPYILVMALDRRTKPLVCLCLLPLNYAGLSRLFGEKLKQADWYIADCTYIPGLLISLAYTDTLGTQQLFRKLAGNKFGVPWSSSCRRFLNVILCVFLGTLIAHCP